MKKISKRKNKIISTIFILLININIGFSQEWKNFRTYAKETGNLSLNKGCWLRKDRKQNNEVWKQANLFNLYEERANEKYKSISQIRDFYMWFDLEIKKQGHEIQAVGVASVAAWQLSKLDNALIRFFIVRNKELVNFANDGSKKVFEFAFPLMQDIYFSDKLFIGEEAKNWGVKNGKIEQCEILEPLYENLSLKSIRKLERMAKGKGIFCLGVPKELKYKGSIKDCTTRFEHGLYTILPFYLLRK